MSTKLTTFSEGKKTFLAVGFIEDRGYDNPEQVAQFRCVDAEGYEFYTDDYNEGIAFLGAGLTPPKHEWTLP
jgi:hypothetical protein